MNLETQIALFAAVFGIIGLISSLIIYKKMRSQRELLEFVGQQVEDLDALLSKSQELLETNTLKVTEQSRRIAWLETRIRQPKASKDEEAIDEMLVGEPQKPNMTERRHRVIRLAALGQNVETIAATLGMLPGEVELIISLNQSLPIKK